MPLKWTSTCNSHLMETSPRNGPRTQVEGLNGTITLLHGGENTYAWFGKRFLDLKPQALSTKESVIKVHQKQTLQPLRYTISSMSMWATDWDKKLTHQPSHTKPEILTYKEPSQVNNKKPRISQKWMVDLTRHCQDYIQMANDYLKKCSGHKLRGSTDKSHVYTTTQD